MNLIVDEVFERNIDLALTLKTFLQDDQHVKALGLGRRP